MYAFDFDWKNPNYAAVYRERGERLQYLNDHPSELPLVKKYYKDHPADFISDYGMTLDPRNVERGLPTVIPFVLFPRQVEWVNWIIDHWRNQKPGLVEKTRDMGMSWLAVSLACTLCLFYPGMAIGFGSRKEEYCDKLGSPKTLLEKARIFMSNLPVEFRGSWNRKDHGPYMRITFPESGSIITAEAGDNIGRGDRTSLYFIDESAYLERPQMIEASLSQTTNCRIDISSPNGRANPFAEKRFSGKIDVFTFHWRDDPRKDDAWYQKQVRELDPVTVASELDIDYAASVEGVLIPHAWIQAAVDAHLKLGVKLTGERSGALDVADEGKDLNAFCGAHGIVIEVLEEWSGKGGDIFSTVERAFHYCEINRYTWFKYDADGLGAGVRGDARVISEKKDVNIQVDAFRGSEAPYDPEGEYVPGRKNKDFFANRKAQAWWALRTRFQNTYRAIVEKQEVDLDEIISIPSSLPLYQRLITELSQPTYSINTVGKILIDKKPDGTKSPNLADAVMIQFSYVLSSLRIWEILGSQL